MMKTLDFDNGGINPIKNFLPTVTIGGDDNDARIGINLLG